MRAYGKFVLRPLVAGFLVLAPIYLAALLLLKALKSLIDLVQPIAKVLPAWLPAEQILALLLILILCFLTGVGIRTRIGHAIWEQIEKSLFQRIPGYALFRSLAQRMAGKSEETAWKPALVEIEEALVPAFIIEELDDGRLTVFVPLGPHAVRWSHLYSPPGSCTSTERSFHAGGQGHFPMGIGFQGSCRCNGTERTSIFTISYGGN